MKYKVLIILSVGLIIALTAMSALAFPPGSGQCITCHVGEDYATCSQCHNDPSFAHTIDDSESPSIGAWPDDVGHTSDITGRWTQNAGVWADYRNYSRNYVPMMPCDNQIPPVYPQDPDYDTPNSLVNRAGFAFGMRCNDHAHKTCP